MDEYTLNAVCIESAAQKPRWGLAKDSDSGLFANPRDSVRSSPE